jgi:hypothetical protein
MTPERRASTVFIARWVAIASTLALLQAILHERTDAKSWLLGTLLGACAGGVQGFVVCVVLARVRAPIARLQSQSSGSLAIAAAAALTGILLPVMFFVVLFLFTRIYYGLTGRTLTEFGGIGFALLVFTFGYLTMTAILGGTLTGFLHSRERSAAARDR